MTVDDDSTVRDLDALTAEPDELDGHTIDELADYLDRGRTPVDAAIETSAACRHALAALQRLRAVSPDLLAGSIPGDDAADERWVTGVLGRIAADARAGADVLVGRTEQGDEVVLTEGALRALVRAAGDDQPGFLVGRVRFAGDLSDPAADVVVELDVTVSHGVPIPEATGRLRRAVLRQVQRHTAVQAPRVDITVRDVVVEPDVADSTSGPAA